MSIRFDWRLEELEALHQRPLLALIFQAAQLHQQFHPVGQIQVCSLISIKTGGCPEDCKYCAQSSRYQTALNAQPMMQQTDVIKSAKEAIAKGATRICLGAAWRQVRDGKQFDLVLAMIREIAEMGVEVCCTLGMLNEGQAKQLKAAGLFAYNHNLDTSEKFYKCIISTRSYQDRLNTLAMVEKASLSICCGGILGLGEEIGDRLELLLQLCRRNPHPESVPVNLLSPITGTPLENQPKVSIWEMVRFIGLARIAMPQAMIRLSCGRKDMTYEQQTLCFLAGANSIFMGEKLLTVANNSIDDDEKLFQILGLKKRPAFAQ